MLLIAIVPIALLMLFGERTPEHQRESYWANNDNSAMAYVVMQKHVESRLKTPGSAEFPLFKNHVEKLGSTRYRITSYVDAQNSYGAAIRTHFVGVVEQADEHEWTLLSLNLKK